MEKKRVVFRRVRGRIIPITVHENNLATGAAMVGGGLGAAATAGAVAAKLVHKAALSEDAVRAAKKSFELNGPLFASAAGFGTEAFKQSDRLYKASRATKHIGFAIAGGLVGLGVAKALKDTKLEKNEDARAAIGHAAGVATVFAFEAPFLRGLGNRGFDLLKKAAKKAF